MNSSSKVIMAATMVMVVSLVMVLSLVLVLLAELYCSLLLRRRRRRRHHNSLNLPTTVATTTLNQAISATSNEPSSSSPNPLYTGVIQTPTKTHIHHEESLTSSLDLIQETKVKDSNQQQQDHNFIYISNPIYSNEATSKQTTPFETPQSSPSRLEDDDDDEDIIETPTLTPMKDLPEKACSVSLKEVVTSASESNNGGGSSSSSGSPYTSPSW